MIPIIYETTLREGMQTPGGIGGSLEERIYAANLISRFADYVEVGMPANAVDSAIINAVKNSFEQNKREAGIAVLCRLRDDEIDLAYEALNGYHKTLVHIFIGTSEEHRRLRFKGKWANSDYESGIERIVAYAASKDFTEIMFSPEDSFRTFIESPEDFFGFVDAAVRGYGIREGKLILNFPDTVGKSTISEFDSMLDSIISRYGDKIEVSLHGHNDGGTALQQSVEAVIKGSARWIQTTFGCLGERNGIAPTEGVIPILSERGYLPRTADDLRQLVPYTKAILGALGRTVPAEAVVSGSRTNVSTAGIHTDLVSKDNAAYHINGDKYGATPIMEFGSTSGAEQILPMLESIGFKFEKSDEKLKAFVDARKDQCNREKRSLTETDIIYHAVNEFGAVEESLKDISYSVRTEKGKKTAVDLSCVYMGNKVTSSSEANGAVEAIVEALDKIVSREIGKLHLVQFEPSVAPKIPEKYLEWFPGNYPEVPSGLDIGSDFRQQVGIMNGSGRVYSGFASGEDTFQAIADSCIDAVVKMTAIESWEENFIKQPKPQ